jgi:hypothetical protein
MIAPLRLPTLIIKNAASLCLPALIYPRRRFPILSEFPSVEKTIRMKTSAQADNNDSSFRAGGDF